MRRIVVNKFIGWKNLFLIIIFTFIAFFISCNSVEQGDGIFLDLKADEYLSKMDEKKDHIIIDVRTPAEYMDSHFKDAMNIDFYADSFKEDIDALDKSKVYFIYCRSGNRSGRVLNLMRELGFNEVYNLSGGVARDTEKFPLVIE